MTQQLNRRQFYIGGFAAALCLSTTGCTPLLMRLIVGRGAAATLTRASFGGGTRASMTFGRGIGLSHSAVRVTNGTRTLPKTRIIRKDGTPIANTIEEAKGTAVYSKGSRVFYSARKNEHHTHIDVNSGHVGYSIPARNNAVALQDREGRTISYDRLRLAKQLIEHYDSTEHLIAETRFSTNEDAMVLSPDSAVIRDIELLSEGLGLNCPETKKAYDTYIENRMLCDEGSSKHCTKATFSHSRYELLKERCFNSR